MEDAEMDDWKIVIISYGLVYNMREQIDKAKFKIVICDETHYIKVLQKKIKIKTIQKIK